MTNDQVLKNSEDRGLTLNTKKTKFMSQQQREKLWITVVPVEKSQKIQILGINSQRNQ